MSWFKRKKADNKKFFIELTSDQLTKDFVGKNYPYYEKKWKHQFVDRRFFRSINWVAFFIFPVWLAYRKMYLYFCIFLGFVFLSIVIETYFDITIPNSVFLVVGFFANYLYFYFVRNKIAKLKSEIKGQNLLSEGVKQAGGVSKLAPSLVIAACVVYVFVALYL